MGGVSISRVPIAGLFGMASTGGGRCLAPAVGFPPGVKTKGYESNHIRQPDEKHALDGVSKPARAYRGSVVADEYRTLAAEQRLLADSTSLTEVRRLFLATAESLELLAAELEQSELAASRLKDKRRRLDGFRWGLAMNQSIPR